MYQSLPKSACPARIRRQRLLLCALFLLATLLAPFNLRAARSAEDDMVTLKGTVVDEQDQPAANVKVLVDLSAQSFPGENLSLETKTDAQGKFTLTGKALHLRGQALQALAPEHRLGYFRLPWQATDQDPALKEIRLQLKPARTLVLEVVDGSGKPIPQAITGLMAAYRGWGSEQTDQAGKATYYLPQDLEIQNVFAISDGHGADYRSFELSRNQLNDQQAKPPQLPENPIRLTLAGTQPLQVKVEATDGTPLTGFNVSVWYLKKEGEPRDLNLSFFYSLVQTQTDATGTASFDWIPRWQKTPLTIWPRSTDYEHQRASYDPQKDKSPVTMKLEKLVPLSGKVTLPDGSPAEGIPVAADGEGYQFDSFRSTVKTDEQGHYSIKAAPNKVYLVIAGNDKWRAAPHTGFAVWPGKPIQNLDFKLQPATRIHGRVTVGSNNEPVADQRILASIRGQDAHNQKDLKLPNPTHSNRWVQPQMVFRARTDEQGNYELFLGPGNYSIRGPSQTPSQKFEITKQKEQEINFHAERPETGILTGSVVAGDPPQPVPSAQIMGIYRKTLSVGDLGATTGEDGQFKVERQRHPVVLHAVSKDKKMAGVVEIGPDVKTVTIPIQPIGSARGQLIDEVTEAPAKNRELRYGVKVHIGDDNAPWRTSFGGTTFTDETGHFELKNLVVGLDYGITIVNRPAKGKPGRLTYRTVKEFKPENSQTIDLGHVEAPRPRKPYVPPTIEQRIATSFGVKGTPLERFDKSKKIGGLTKQYPLILFGDPKSKSIKELMTLRYEDQEIRPEIYSFLMMAIADTGKKREAAQALAETLDVKLNPQPGQFELLVFDTQGKLLARGLQSDLSTDGKVSKQKLLKFLKDHQYPTLDARELLDTALKQAKEQNKRVIVQETATWCGPCRLLSLYLDRERKIWERDYIWIKLDHRWTGTREIMEKMRDGAQGGIPWWTILDADGKILVTSNNDQDKGQNIGFPSSSSGRQHFRNMLEKTAIRLNSMEINELVEALKQKQD